MQEKEKHPGPGRPAGKTLWGVKTTSQNISAPHEFFEEWTNREFKEEVRDILVRRGKLSEVV